MLTWGPDWERDLCDSPYRLRFELGQGHSHLNRFATAFDRARALARRAIRSVDIIGVVAAFPDPEAEINAEVYGWAKSTSFQHLKAMGVPTENALGSWKGYFWSDDEFDEEAHPWSHRAIQLTWDQADVLLWNQIAHDMGVSPQAPIQSKLVDSERAVSVHAYDDRGMDVTATTRDALVGIYHDFGEWLLDYDRERMAAVFGA